MYSIKRTLKIIAFSMLIALFCATATRTFAGNEKKNSLPVKQKTLWQQTNEKSLATQTTEQRRTGKYLVYSINRTLLNGVFEQSPLEFTDAARQIETILEIPTPDGKTERFRIQETQLLAPEVAAQFPTWKYFVGQGVDDPTATARFDINALGFHGYVSGANGTYLIDPYSLTDQKNYIVYYKGDLGDSNRENFSCEVRGGRSDDERLLAPTAAQPFSNGTSLRTLKLAVSATKEYTAYFRLAGDTDAQAQTRALAAVQTSINRINLIYVRELSVTFNLISDTRSVFTAANTGGFVDATDPNVSSLSIAQNPKTLNSIYGVNAYDIGHAVSRTPNPNGLASSPSVCANNAPATDPTSTYKGQGFTGSTVPQGDGYDVDYLAHELGHQFGMSHTFNNDVDGSCNTRAPDSAFEPASGITIMGYGGICAPRNLAQNSIDFFNLRSFEQAFGELATQPTDGTCGTITSTNPANAVPTVTTANGFTIPKLTPFTLTAAGADTNGDALTYLWEEYDNNTTGATGSVPRTTAADGNPVRNGVAVDTDEDGIVRPIFRAYRATTSPSRTFPSLNYILNNANVVPLTYTGTLPVAVSGSTNGYVCATNETCVSGERLPSIARTMVFRVTARDNRAGGGGVADAQTTLTVVNVGPFQVTAQNSRPSSPNAPEATWQANTQQTVTWDVAGTDANGINVANVSILLSTDGGQTFPTTLVASTANNGTATITVPNMPTTTARIKVQAVGNIFFDINNANFTILAPTAAAVSISGRVLSQIGRGVAGATVRFTDQNGGVRMARTNSFGYYNLAEVSAGQTYVVSVSAKGYQFAPQVVTPTENLAGLDFRAQ